MTPLTSTSGLPACRSSFAPDGGISVLPRAATWTFAVLLSVYLGLSGGGYDIVVRSEIGLIIWWLVLLGVVIGVLPRAGSPRAGWLAAALLTGFLAWTWIGLSWTSSHELTLDEVCRVSTYLGVFVLGLCTVRADTARSMLNGLGCGIAAVSGLAILSKLDPGLFPADTAASFYATARLSYPFDYADGVGEYGALGIPLLLFMATSGRTILSRALATAALQLPLLCLAMTVSRGGILAAFAGIVAFLALMPDRLPRLPTLAISAAGIGALMVALLGRASLRNSVGVAPASQRHSMLAILLVVEVLVAVAGAGATLVMQRHTRARWSAVSRRGARAITAGIIVTAIALVIVGSVAGTVGTLWSNFKIWNPSTHTDSYSRLLSIGGSHRYQYWQIAWKAFTGSVLHGIGPGTFRFFWDQHTTHAEYVLNAHSLWFETLAETGIVGGLLIAGFFGFVLIGGLIRSLRASGERRMIMATATAGIFAFCAAAGFDWVWQIGVVPMVALLIAGLSFLPDANDSRASTPQLGNSAASGSRIVKGARVIRGGCAVLVLLAMVLVAIPLASTVALRKSQTAADVGKLAVALRDTSTAIAIEPGSASPYLEQALIYEQRDELISAAASIRAAIAREPANSDLWLVASRLETERDQPRRALADYARAQKLYPTSTVVPSG